MILALDLVVVTTEMKHVRMLNFKERVVSFKVVTVAWLTIDKILAVTTFHFFAAVVVKISRFRLAIVTVIVWGLGYILGGFFSPCIHLNQHLSWIKKFLYIFHSILKITFSSHIAGIYTGFFLIRRVGWEL